MIGSINGASRQQEDKLPQLISDDEHPCSSGIRQAGSLSAESRKMPDFQSAALPPLTFCARCALKRFENLWNVSSLSFCTEFSLLGSSHSSRDAVKTRVIQPRRNIWVAAFTAVRRLVRRGTPSLIGTEIPPAE